MFADIISSNDNVICHGWINKIIQGGGCHALGRSRWLYLEHLVTTSISYQRSIHNMC